MRLNYHRYKMSDAISSFTASGDDLDETTQTSGADIALKMTGNLGSFTGESDKEQLGNIGAKVTLICSRYKQICLNSEFKGYGWIIWYGFVFHARHKCFDGR